MNDDVWVLRDGTGRTLAEGTGPPPPLRPEPWWFHVATVVLAISVLAVCVGLLLGALFAFLWVVDEVGSSDEATAALGLTGAVCGTLSLFLTAARR